MERAVARVNKIKVCNPLDPTGRPDAGRSRWRFGQVFRGSFRGSLLCQPATVGFVMPEGRAMLGCNIRDCSGKRQAINPDSLHLPAVT
jgi:hypothetical protein